MRPVCQLRCVSEKLTTPLTKIASAGGGAGDYSSATRPVLGKTAYPSITPIRVESINNDLRVVVPIISTSLIRNLHPIHEVENSFFVKIHTSFERIVRGMNAKTSISSIV